METLNKFPAVIHWIRDSGLGMIKLLQHEEETIVQVSTYHCRSGEHTEITAMKPKELQL